ncbi:hypothetical protein BC826DRAFT_598505 [Russula brevipes]|nr:hypothetical protein BC826DRAFT_598505 [Russula brevipes]
MSMLKKAVRKVIPASSARPNQRSQLQVQSLQDARSSKSSVFKETIRKIVPASSSADAVHQPLQSCRNKQSKSSIVKRAIRRICRPPSTTTHQAIASPPSSEPNGGIGDTAMSGIEMSLSALKEATALTAKIPYISVVAGLLLQALTMRDEAKQYKEEWELVMEKVEKVAGLVTYIGASCERYELEEKDLPPGLGAIFECLETELDGIGRALAQNRQVGGIKKIILRKELLRKVKQYDGRLSTVLQTFQAALAVDLRFAQLAEGPKVYALVLNDDNELTSSIRRRSIVRSSPVPQGLKLHGPDRSFTCFYLVY